MNSVTTIFPSRKADGSFCIEFRLRVVADDDPIELASRINDWIETWVRTNRYWKTSLANAEGGVLDFYDEFARPPYCVTTESRCLFLRVEGRADAGKWWRDWIAARLGHDLRDTFKETIQFPFEKARNCPEVDQ
jgi:hypothetical protein